MKKQLSNESLGVTGVTSLSVCRIPHNLSPNCVTKKEPFPDSFSQQCLELGVSMGGITPDFPWHVLGHAALTSAQKCFR